MMLDKLKALSAYIQARLNEKSTWAALSVGVIGASALPSPWSYVAMVMAVLGVFANTTSPSQ